jgi:nucleoside-diphosphate-sugar epimerase
VSIGITELLSEAYLGATPPVSQAFPHLPASTYSGPGFEDTRRRVSDITRAAEILDWTPEVSLEDGLACTIEWWEKTHR